MKVRFRLSIGYAGAEHETVEQYPDDVNDQEIERDLKYLGMGTYRPLV